MFEENSHIIDTSYVDKTGFVTKSTKDRLSLLKEVGLQSLLVGLGISPSIIYNEDSSFFQEQRIETRQWAHDNIIIGVAKQLYKLHSIELSSVSNHLISLLKNDFIINQIPQIKALFEFIISKVINNNLIPSSILSKVTNRIGYYQKILDAKGAYTCITHGDLNPGNILTGDSVLLIDYSDARIDMPIFDVAQVFYHFHCNKDEIKLFKEAYGEVEYYEFIDIHMSLIYFYDLVFGIQNNELQAKIIVDKNGFLIFLNYKFMNNILIFAPHPDDEIIGCGGTIAKAIAKGYKVGLVFLTYGEYGSPSVLPDELKKIRQTESLLVADYLGIDKDNIFFLGIGDNSISANDTESFKKIIKIIRDFKPSIVYIPNHEDNYYDHSQASVLTKRALDMAGSNNFSEFGGMGFWVEHVLEYELYTPFKTYSYAEDISDYIEYKIKAMELYSSQTKSEGNVSSFVSNKVSYLSGFRAAYSIGEYREVFNVIRTANIL